MVWLQSLMFPSGPTALLKRCLCGKLIQVETHVRRCHSGIVNYDEALCPDCAKNFEHHARIVCLACKSLQGFVEPYKDRVTGFVMLRDRCYHIKPCPRCVNGVARTPVLEHVEHCRRSGIPVRDDFDLLQEIEQKSLQGEEAAAKLRGELQQFNSKP